MAGWLWPSRLVFDLVFDLDPLKSKTKSKTRGRDRFRFHVFDFGGPLGLAGWLAGFGQMAWLVGWLVLAKQARIRSRFRFGPIEIKNEIKTRGRDRFRVHVFYIGGPLGLAG